MYPNSEEKLVNHNNEGIHTNTPVINEQSDNLPIYTEPRYNEQPYQASAQNTPGYGEPSYGEQIYSKPVEYQPVINESREVPPSNMYSPGVFVSPPYPRAYANTSERSGTQRPRSGRLGGFLRAVCLVIVCSLFSATAAYIVMDYRFDRGDFATTNQVVLGGNNSDNRQEGNYTTPVAAHPNSISAQDIYDIARTQVVGIITETPGLFGDIDPFGSTPVSGSGFIISSDGYILTNFHVIELAYYQELPLSVILNDGTSYDAEVIGFEQNNDVAVLKINASGLNPALIGNSENIRVGQTIYAVGNPFGDLVYTMTDGIVSALDRVVSVEGKSISTFQFSAAVNRGNSGGPIYNTEGEVLGIVTAKVVRGNVEGIGFAIPINDAIDIASELIEHGYISGRPLIGITGQTVSPGHADYYDWVVGVYVRSVAPDSAAESAGLAVGDIIIGLDDERIDSMELLRFALRSHKAGDTTTLTIWRNGEKIDLTITFDEDMYAGQPQTRPPPEAESPDPFEDYP